MDVARYRHCPTCEKRQEICAFGCCLDCRERLDLTGPFPEGDMCRHCNVGIVPWGYNVCRRCSKPNENGFEISTCARMKKLGIQMAAIRRVCADCVGCVFYNQSLTADRVATIIVWIATRVAAGQNNFLKGASMDLLRQLVPFGRAVTKELKHEAKALLESIWTKYTRQGSWTDATQPPYASVNNDATPPPELVSTERIVLNSGPNSGPIARLKRERDSSNGASLSGSDSDCYPPSHPEATGSSHRLAMEGSS